MKYRTFEPLDPRRLSLVYLNHPRAYPGPDQPWELHRGFRLRVLEEKSLALFLGQPADLLSRTPQTDEDSFLVLPAPLDPRAEDLSRGLSLAAEEGWCPGVTLILSDDRRLQRPFRRLKTELKAACPKGHSGLIVWVLQEMPAEIFQGLDFFNAEQNLHQLGRIGRRVSRRVRWRRYLP